MTDTKAGRALLDAIATNERLSPSGLRMAEYRQAAAAIEREAAQQERERLLPVLAALSQSAYLIQKDGHYCDESPHSDRCGSLIWDIEKARAILADNSPSASAEPDGEPSE